MSGFTNSSSTWIVSDNVGPAMTTDALATPPKAIVDGDTYLSVNFTDAWVDVDTVTVNLTAIGLGIEDMEFNTSETGLWEYEATVGADIEDGVYYLNITATDDLGNENATEFFLFEVVTDSTSPVMGAWTVDYPIGKTTAREGDDVNVTIIVTDLPAGVSDVVINGSEIGAAPDTLMARIGTTDSYSANLTVETVLDGTYYLNVTATDYAGNTNSTLVTVLIQEIATIEMYTTSTDYDSRDTVNFYVSAAFAFNLSIEILDPNAFTYTTITCLENTHWIRIGDYSIVPYEASFNLPTNAISGTWNWTATDTTVSKEVANGTFTVGVAEPQPDLPAETTGEETLDSNGVAKTSFTAGETVLASSTIANTGTQSQSMVIAVQWTDSELRALAPSFILVTLAPGADFTYAAGLVVPATGFAAGTWTAKINVFDAWPALGGVAIGEPVTITFTVTD